MNASARDLWIAILLLIAWVLSSFGIATESWALTAAALPSIAGAGVLHIVGIRRRTPSTDELRVVAEAMGKREAG